MEVKEQHHVHTRRKFAALTNMDFNGGFKIVCENITENK
jgi:hypothetical protein